MPKYEKRFYKKKEDVKEEQGRKRKKYVIRQKKYNESFNFNMSDLQIFYSQWLLAI